MGKDQFNKLTYGGRSFKQIVGMNHDYWMQINDSSNFFLLVSEPEKANYKKALQAYYDEAMLYYDKAILGI